MWSQLIPCYSSLVRLSTPPGTKFVVTNDIAVEEDLLMLGPGVLKNIGGHVDAMVNEWKASKVNYFHPIEGMDTGHILTDEFPVAIYNEISW